MGGRAYSTEPGVDRRAAAVRRIILRPSMVQERLHPVQPSSSPNRPEILPVFPIVPPHWQRPPGATLGLRRMTRRAMTGDCRAIGRFS